MPPRYLTAVLIAALWLVVSAAYVWAGWQQMERLNLSAAAGGQYPYLTHAKRIADVGVAESYGDRNRMPLYPSLLSVVGHTDWDTFVQRSGWFAIATSVMALVAVGVIAYATLSLWPATVLTLAATVCVFIYKASFVQAELSYYALLFASWLALCRVIHRPDLRWAAVGGLGVGLAYLTKASASAILAAFAASACVKALALARPRQPALLVDFEGRGRRRWASILLSAAIVGLVFLATVYPYISNNKTHFGRYFYNINSTFFMWCDSWTQASWFAQEYNISEQYPDAPPEEIPGPVNYWRTHTPGHMANRMGYGIKTLVSLAVEEPFFKYFLATLGFCVILGFKHGRRLKELWRDYWPAALFSALFFVGYLVAFAWYSLVAYGGRFLLSLFLPAMFILLWVGDQLARVSRPLPFLGYRVRKTAAFGMVLVILLMGELGVTATTTLYEPGKAFVQFYYNESRELLAAGKLEEAEKGTLGVLRLAPEFAPAHHQLGMIALRTDRIDGAIVSLSIAKDLDPQVADTRNSLGSALVQAGRPQEAVAEFQRATELDPSFASAWYNLGGTYCLIRAFDEAKRVRRQLEVLDPKLARQLAALIEDGAGVED